MVPLKLSGKEIRFLRKAADWTAKQLAEIIGVTPESVSRWENGKEVVGPTSEKLLRIMTVMHLTERAPAIDRDLDELLNMRIQSVRSSEDLPPLAFGRVMVKLSEMKKKEPFWDKSEAPQAA